MRIESIELNNIRSYDEQSVDIDTGLVLLYGENGAGKSSLLSSIFSGLYMSDVLKFMGDDINLDSLVRRGEDEGSIELKFGINGDIYTINWVISVREESEERKASTKSCTLTGGELDEPIEGVRDVKASVEDIMGLGPESFVNSVYVQQGDITRMVNADKNKRKEIIDGLLGLSKLDNYIDRMDKARLEFGSQRRTVDELLNEKQRQLNDLNNSSTIKKDIERLENEKKDYEDKKQKVNKTLDKYQEKILNLEQKIKQYDETDERREELKSEVNEKNKRRKELETKKENLQKEIESIETERSVIKDGIDSTREDLGRRGESLEQLKDEIEEIRDSIADLNSEITRVKDGKISNLKSDIQRNNSQITDKKSTIDEKRNDMSEVKNDIQEDNKKKSNIQSEIDEIERKIEEKRSLLDEKARIIEIEYEDLDELREIVIPEERNKQIERTIEICKDLGGTEEKKNLYEDALETDDCPICKEEHSNHSVIEEHYKDIKADIDAKEQKVSSIRNQEKVLDKVEEVSSDIQGLEKEKDIKKNELERVQNDLERKNAKLEDLEESIENLENEIKSIEDENDSLTERKQELERDVDRLNNKVANKKETKSSVEDLVSDIEDLQELEEEIKDREKKIDQYEELRQNSQRQFVEKKKELKKVKDKLEDISVEESREKKNKLSSKKEELSNKRNEIESKIGDLQEKIASKNQDLKRVESLNSRINALEQKKVEAAEKENEAEEVIYHYEGVKSQLREENIGLLNKYANEIFNSVYDNKVYQRMTISKEYDIKLVTGDNVEVDPKDLSGGEKTIVSLSIRAGVYKLLVERQGSADTLPPFILDEPTTYLDSSHVSNLQDVIETITSWDVPQVLIVSHREDMIQNADAGYEVQKDPTSETSEVSKRY